MKRTPVKRGLGTSRFGRCRGNETVIRTSNGLIVLLALATLPNTVAAQFGGGGLAGGGFGGGGGGGFGGQQGGFASGIKIDAKGIVQAAISNEKAGKLQKRRFAAFAADHLPEEISAASELRKISLVKLEHACREFVRNGKHVGPEMQYMAGLQRIDYVFVYPETGDLVIAGPAEGFAPNAVGRVVGVESGRPPIRLDDLIVALRTVPTSSMIGCSIDPTQKSLAKFQEYLRRNSSPATPAQIQQRFREMTQTMGLQNVSVFGVPANSHFAQTLVEADYRMKLMSLGLEKPGLRGFRSHLEMIGRNANTMQRWWFTPFYESLNRTEDGNAFQFVGQRVQLMSQDEQVNAAGERSSAAFTKVTTQKFSKQFTDRYEDVAAVSPIFAELQNVIDLAILAALIGNERLNQRIEWPMDIFLDRENVPLITGNTPKQVATVCNYRRSKTLITGLVGGGVTINPRATLRSIPRGESDDRILISQLRDAEPRDEASRWWWD